MECVEGGAQGKFKHGAVQKHTEKDDFQKKVSDYHQETSNVKGIGRKVTVSGN